MPQLNVILVGQRGLSRDHLIKTAKWFDRHPGPIKVTVVNRSVNFELDEDGILEWDTAFRALKELRLREGLAPSDALALLTHSPNKDNWYAVHDENNLRNGFIHVDDFSWATSAPGSVISAHYILKGIFNAFIAEGGFDRLHLLHWKPRGCFFDFCQIKTDLNLKLRTADICGDCMDVLCEVGVPDDLLQQAMAIMDASRLLALNTRQFRPIEEPFSRWPFPVAVTKHKVVQATNPLLRFLLLLDHFDSLIRYFYLIREIREGNTPQLVDRPSLGWWVDQLARSLEEQPLFREVVAIAQKENVVALRNERRGHGYMAICPQAYEEDASRLKEIIARIEEELTPFFDSHRLLILRRTEPRNGIYIAEGEELKGSHLLHPSFTTNLPSDPISAGLSSVDQVFVSDPQLQKFHCISPFIRSAICPTCHHSRILVTDGGNQFIDVFMGHRVELF